jgi:protein-tyrosine phosphatase
VIGIITEFRSNNRRVFVHCDMGESRSPMLVAAHLMQTYVSLTAL